MGSARDVPRESLLLARHWSGSKRVRQFLAVAMEIYTVLLLDKFFIPMQTNTSLEQFFCIWDISQTIIADVVGIAGVRYFLRVRSERTGLKDTFKLCRDGARPGEAKHRLVSSSFRQRPSRTTAHSLPGSSSLPYARYTLSIPPFIAPGRQLTRLDTRIGRAWRPDTVLWGEHTEGAVHTAARPFTHHDEQAVSAR